MSFYPSSGLDGSFCCLILIFQFGEFDNNFDNYLPYILQEILTNFYQEMSLFRIYDDLVVSLEHQCNGAKNPFRRRDFRL